MFSRTVSLLPQLQIPRKLFIIFQNMLSQAEEPVLVKGLTFFMTYPHSNLDIACAVESVASNLPQILGMEFEWKIILEESKPSRPDKSKMNMKAMRSLRLNKDIRIPQADKGNCIVMLNGFGYKD
jgi:hypothetical protein